MKVRLLMETEPYKKVKGDAANYQTKAQRRIISLKFICSILTLLLVSFSFSKEVSFTQEDRERLIRLETKVDIGFQQIDKRFEQIDKRFEQVDKRMEQVEKRMDDLITFIWIITGVFVSIVGITIGFALWDRRTMIKPFEDKMREVERRLLGNEGDNKRLVEALKKLAQKDQELREILKEHGII